MKIISEIYNGNEIEIQKSGDNIMVNATQMAKIHDKRLDHFLRSEHAKAFINELELTPFGGRSQPLKREQIIKTVNGKYTYFHRWLALKFAAWINTKFEIWVYSTIDKILLGHYSEVKEATEEKLKKKNELELKKAELIKDNPGILEYFELETELNKLENKRIKAIKEATKQLRFDIFD